MPKHNLDEQSNKNHSNRFKSETGLATYVRVEWSTLHSIHSLDSVHFRSLVGNFGLIRFNKRLRPYIGPIRFLYGLQRPDNFLFIVVTQYLFLYRLLPMRVVFKLHQILGFAISKKNGLAPLHDVAGHDWCQQNSRLVEGGKSTWS